ncbi:MAG: carboxymuconolactone decarboxylase family protein [Anaerolineae bacterium]|nr:carboxymuconolactone decarboxylase family protein [Anaerolineae bacterium]
MQKFRRRTYHNLYEIWADFRFIVTRRALVKKAMRELLSPAFRERLMLTVTQVNQCRYCRSFHSQQALEAGLDRDELAALLDGQIPADTPQDEIPALVYALHWAENNARPDRQAVQHLAEVYGTEMSEAIHIVLRMIRMGNLSGNTADYILYRLTLGHAGI